MDTERVASGLAGSIDLIGADSSGFCLDSVG